MRVIILATYFAPDLGGGVARYEREVLPRLLPLLVAAGCEVTVLVLKDGNGWEPAKGVRVITVPVGRDQPFKRFVYDQLYGSRQSWGTDVLFSMEYWLPLLPVWSKRSIVVIHDAHAELEWIKCRWRPLDAKFRRFFYWHNAYTKAARLSDRILTDSVFAGEEISRVFRVPREKIRSIYLGVDTRKLCPVKDRAVIGRVRKRYTLPDRYDLFVGPPCGDKNLRYILKSFVDMEAMHPGVLPVVVSSARPGPSVEAELVAQLEAAGRGHLVHFAGHVKKADLAVVYSAARALIFPSLHEGFGLPPLEAMACGTPVIATNRTSVPEVVGDAAIVIDPGDSQSLLTALEKIRCESVRQDLIARGLERVKIFSWDRTAQQVAEELVSEVSPASSTNGGRPKK